MIEYRIKEEGGEEPREAVIIKSGVDVEFTMSDIARDEQYLQKKKQELAAQMRVEKAKMENVKGTHPQAADMSEEDRIATYLYQQSFAYCKVAESKLRQIEDQLKDYAAEKELILSQFPQLALKAEAAPEETKLIEAPKATGEPEAQEQADNA